MPDQYARPDADTSVGDWYDSGSMGEDLFEFINEAITDDDDYIYVEDVDGSPMPITFSLSSVTDPASGSGHSVVVRADDDGMGNGTTTLNVHLKDGSTSIKNEDFDLSMDPDDHTMSLSTAQANSISSGGYNNLTLILTSTDTGEMGITTKVYQAYFRCPEAASSSVPIAAIAMNTYRQMRN